MMTTRTRLILALLLAALIVAAVALGLKFLGERPGLDGIAIVPVQVNPTPEEEETPTPRPTRTPEPLVPTLLPSSETPTALPAPEAGQPVATGIVSETATLSDTLAPPLPLVDLRSRLGLGVPPNVADFTPEIARQLGLGWYLNWSVRVEPVRVEGLEFVQVILVRGDSFQQNRARLVDVLAANPGSLWLIGNEPDVPWQGNKTPEEYAVVYHEAYTFLKTLDPSARVAIGGISQVTPLRILYLERALAHYEALYGEAMPVDIWNIHAFILREELDSWGVSIPPGFDITQGQLWEIEDHDDLALFRQQIIDFRRWMARNGQRGKPLIVSEYGILMPEGYGFPLERVARFMAASFDYLLKAQDPEIGYPADDNRLVQRLAWFSFSDTTYPTGNLVDPETGEFTLLGRAFADYAAQLGE